MRNFMGLSAASARKFLWDLSGLSKTIKLFE
jgi:hypothetical protein